MKTYEDAIREESLMQGEIKGQLEGASKKMKEVALNLLKKKFNPKEIIDICGCTKEDLNLWAQEPNLKLGF